jgi:hypothetical protein
MSMTHAHRWASIMDPNSGTVEGIWIDVFKRGEVYIPKEDGEVKSIPLTVELFRSIIANFELMSAVGKPPKVQKAHGEDGYNYGDVVRWRIDATDDVEVLQAFITLKHPEDRERYNLGMIQQFSPGFHLNYMRTDTGERIGPHVFDVSMVTRAHQENLRDPKDINPGVFLSAQHTEAATMAAEEENTFNAEEACSAMAETLSAVVERLSALEAMIQKEEDEEMSAEPSEGGESEALSARIVELEDQNTRLSLSAYDIDEDEVTHLVSLKRADSALFSAHVAKLPKKSTQTVQAEIGTSAPAGGVSLNALVAEGIELGHKPGTAAFVGWAHTKHANKAADIIKASRSYSREG